MASANIRLITVLMRAPPNTSSLTNQNYCCPFLCDKAKFNCCFMTQNPIKNKNIWYILFVSMASFWNYPLFPPLCFFAYIGWIIANVSDAEMCKADFYLSFMYRAGNDKIDADINRLKIVTSQNKSWIKAQHFKCTSRNLRHPRKVENAPEFVM